MRIAITGATGFLGSNLIKELSEQGNEVYGIIRKTSKIQQQIKEKAVYYVYDGTVSSLIEIFQKIKPEVVIHTAAFFVSEHTTEQVDILIDSNIRFSTHVLEAMACSGITKLINTSTSWENYHDEEYNPSCLYAATKRAIEDIIRYYVEVKGIQAITLVLYDTYGKYDVRGKILQKFFEIAKSREEILMSKGEQEIALLYIEDAIRAYQVALNMLIKMESGYEKYYLLPNEIYPLKKVAEIFEKMSKTTLEIRWGERPYRQREVMTVYRKGKKLPNWETKVTLEEGIKRLLEED